MSLGPVITSRSNAKVKELRASFNGKASEPGELLGIEGEHLIAEALRSEVTVRTLFVREGSEATLQRLALSKAGPENIMSLSADVFSSAVDTGSPQGVAALIQIPVVKAEARHHGLVLLLEALQDPGNLGTLLRAAEAFGARAVFMTPDSVNPWGPKAVRASAGSVFRMPVVRMPLQAMKSRLKAEGMKLIAAVAQASGAVASLDADLARECAIMIGNEGAGLSAEALALCDEQVHIPCMTESLNAAVAGAVLMYEAMRQHISQVVPPQASSLERP